jgi:hypothetical protein
VPLRWLPRASQRVAGCVSPPLPARPLTRGAPRRFLQWACEKLSIDPSRLRKGVGADVLSSEEEEVPGEEELSVQQMLGEMRVPSGA